MVDGLPVLKNELIDCEGFALGKMYKDEFPYSLNRIKKDNLNLYILIYVDPCRQGP